MGGLGMPGGAGGAGMAQAMGPAGKLFGDQLPQYSPLPPKNPLFRGSIDEPSAGPVESIPGKELTPGAPMPGMDPKAPIPGGPGARPPMAGPPAGVAPPTAQGAGPATGLLGPSGQGFDTSAPEPRGLFGKGGFMDALQAKLKDAPTNPLFQMGMGLASSGFDGSNPYAAITKNLGNIPAMQQAALLSQLRVNADNREQSKSEREAADAKNQTELALMLSKIGQQYANPQTEGSSRIQRGAKVIR
jgi:hypothetical protein